MPTLYHVKRTCAVLLLVALAALRSDAAAIHIEDRPDFTADSTKAAQTFDVMAATTLTFDSDFQLSFGYQQGHYACCMKIMNLCVDHCTICAGSVACFTPGSCSTGCGSGANGTIVVPSIPTTTLHRNESVVMSPNGSLSCLCPGYSGFATPEFPLSSVQQSVTCTMNGDGLLQASNVVNPGWNDPHRVAGTAVSADGAWVAQGCSVATVTYSGAAWTESGGNEGCGSSTHTMSSPATFVASGYCCMNATLTPVYPNGGQCFGEMVMSPCFQMPPQEV